MRVRIARARRRWRGFTPCSPLAATVGDTGDTGEDVSATFRDGRGTAAQQDSSSGGFRENMLLER